MAKRQSFEDKFMPIYEDKNNEPNEPENKDENLENNVPEIKVEPTKVITQEVMQLQNVVEYVSLNEHIKNLVSDLENKIKNESGSKFKAKKKLTYSDKYVGITISIRPELKAIIEELRNVSSLDKYEILEMLFINGLKHTNFDE